MKMNINMEPKNMSKPDPREENTLSFPPVRPSWVSLLDEDWDATTHAAVRRQCATAQTTAIPKVWGQI